MMNPFMSGERSAFASRAACSQGRGLVLIIAG
jgi:hypothetical protein